MKCTIPEISWHNREPVLSVDFQYSDGNICRLATGGTDAHVLIWFVTVETKGQVKVDFAADLRRHNKAVNVVRFSPCDLLLASGDDEATIWLWKKIDKDSGDIFNEDEDKDSKEYWNAYRTLRGHVEDVCDLGWSPDGNNLISGSVDNTAILWDVHKGRNLRILSDHKGFVQGVAWDPKNKYVATLCSDRICRIYNVNNRRIVHKVNKAVISTINNKNLSKEEAPGRPVRLFHDDTLKTFCRRLTFSPDGELLITPSGYLEVENGKNINTTYVFSRHCLNKPALYFPTMDKYTVAVSCCPILFQLRSTKEATAPEKNSKSWEINNSMFKLPYRIVFAVAMQDAVLLYDTQQSMPFGQVSKIHYTRLSDLAWSKDGSVLCVSSTDGYCSFITFDEKELGIPYVEAVDPTKAHLPLAGEESSSNHKTEQKVDATVNITTHVTLSNAEESPSLQSKPQKKRVSLVTLFSPKQKLSPLNTGKNVSGNDAEKPHRRTKLQYPDDLITVGLESSESKCNTLTSCDLAPEESAIILSPLDVSDTDVRSSMFKPNKEMSEKNMMSLVSETKEELPEIKNQPLIDSELISECSIQEMTLNPTSSSKQDSPVLKNISKAVANPTPRRIQPTLISKKSR